MKKLALVALLSVVGCAAETDVTQSDSADQTGASAPGWIGNGFTAVDRDSCSGEPCNGSSGVALEKGFGFGDWARQRAAFARGSFEVWKQGVTDYANADLAKQLDVKMHYRYGKTGTYETKAVTSDKQVGNNARYVFDLRSFDRLYLPTNITKKEQCPAVPLVADASDVQTELQYYFTANGTRYPEGTAVFHGFYSAPKGMFAMCPSTPAP